MTPRRFRRLAAILDRRQDDLTVLMDNVHKPHNVSAVMRTADAVGILDMHAVAPDGRFRARKVAASGAQRFVRMHTHADHARAAAHLAAQGMQIVAAHPVAEALDFRAIDYTAPTAVLLGSELDGLADEARAIADRFIVVPMRGAVASLNVSVAAAVILYEAERQRAAAGLYDRSRIDADRRRTLLFEWGYPRLAAFCHKKGLPYPRLDDEGGIIDPLPRG